PYTPTLLLLDHKHSVDSDTAGKQGTRTRSGRFRRLGRTLKGATSSSSAASSSTSYYGASKRYHKRKKVEVWIKPQGLAKRMKNMKNAMMKQWRMYGMKYGGEAMDDEDDQ
ncbi:hypothetical protein Tco_0301583, partial [Tanacetum coccineum]